MPRSTTREGLLLFGFVVFALTPFAVSATTASFWKPEHSTAPVATSIYLAIVAALVVGRYRWAWVLLTLFYGAAVVGWAFDSHRFSMRGFWYCLSLGTLLLLTSSPMRHRLRDPIASYKAARE